MHCSRRLQAELAARLTASLSGASLELVFDAAMACNDAAMGDTCLRFVLEHGGEGLLDTAGAPALVDRVRAYVGNWLRMLSLV